MIPLDILTIYSPLITLNLIKIFMWYIQRNFSWPKQILQTKKLLSLIWYKSYWQSCSIPALTTNAMTSNFLSSVSLGWVVIFPDPHCTVFTFLSWLDLLGVVLAFWISIPKICKSLPNYLHRVTDITSFEKHLKSSSGHTLSFYPNGEISFQECFLKNLSPGLLRWSSLQTKEGQLRFFRLENSLTPSMSNVCPSDHREDDRSSHWPFYSLLQIFPKVLHSD